MTLLAGLLLASCGGNNDSLSSPGICPALTLSCDAGVMGDDDHRRVMCVIELSQKRH